MNRVTTLPLVLSLLIAACGHAPPPTIISVGSEPSTTQLIGEGRLSAAPEYVELSVRVVAECFATPAQASAAADALTARVIEILKGATAAGNPIDGVFSHGGFTQPFVRYDNGVLSCKDTFEKRSDVVLKTSRVREFPTLFVDIQREVLGGGSAAQPGARGALTYATLATPIPRLTYKTQERLEKQALAAAIDSAQQKFAEATRVACKGARHRIVRFVERDPDDARPIAYERSQPPANVGPTIELDAIWINKLLEVHFTFDDAQCAA